MFRDRGFSLAGMVFIEERGFFCYDGIRTEAGRLPERKAKMEVRTLVELYDARPLENVLGVEFFHPEQVIYICPKGAPYRAQKQLRDYFTHRGVRVRLQFRFVDIFDAREVLAVFRDILAQYPDAAMDITGGTDAVLFAAGLACSGTEIPVFTYSRSRNRFFSIQHALSIDGIRCKTVLSVEDCFLMAGGSMRKGRVDNEVLSRYRDDFAPFFSVFLQHRTQWDKVVSYIQRVSPAREDGTFSLKAEGGYTVKGEHGTRLTAPEEALRDLEQIQLISGLEIIPEEKVSFRFRDAQVRAWLRDVGSVLELYVYKACLESGLFDDVRVSAVVDWNDGKPGTTVSNELDVMCTRGITPVFISCKTCMIRTEALNELAVLRDRFGGEMARAAIVTAEPAGSAARNRAAELNIRIIDLNDLEEGTLVSRIQRLMNADNSAADME